MRQTVEFIVPCHNERDNVRTLRDEFDRAFEGCALEWGLIMVDDGSTDGTFSQLDLLATEDSRVRVIRLSRNFGKESAMYAGLVAAEADYIGIIDADLQQPPRVAREMLEELLSDDSYDCVAAYQEERREGFIVSALKRRFYQVFAKASRSEIIEGASDFRVFRRSVACAVLQMPEYYRFSKGIFAWVGFSTKPFPYVPEERAAGETKWTIGSLFSYAIEGILSFTTSPLHFITRFGIAVCGVALIYALVLIFRTLLMGVDLPGYASTVALILILGGGQFFAIGIIGEYLARAYVQGKGRPVFIVKETRNLSGKSLLIKSQGCSCDQVVQPCSSNQNATEERRGQ